MKLPIPDLTQSSGHIIAFYHRGQLLFGCIESTDGINHCVVLADAERISLNSSRILLCSFHRYAPESKTLLDFRKSLSQISLQELPIMPEGSTLPEIAEALHIDSDEALFALLIHLKDSSHLYLQKHDRYYRRSAEEMACFLEKQKERSTRENFIMKAVELISNPAAAPESDIRDQLLQELRILLRGERIDDLQKAIRATHPDKKLGDIRAELGDRTRYPDPPLQDSGLPISFSAELLPEIAARQNLPISDIVAYSIDDEDSKDFDDAISMSQDDGYLLGIHVSNLAIYLDDESRLFNEAANRISSLYLPSGVVPMLPPVYSEQVFSLTRHEPKAVLSLYARMDQNFDLIETYIKSEIITIAKNLSYNEVDKSRHSDMWNPYFKAAAKLRELRETSPKNEERRFIYNLQVKNDGVSFHRIDLLSPARRMIEEFMILYNSSLADYACLHHIPMLYRNISQFYDSEKNWQTSTAYLDTKAGFHPGIGAKAYLHSTSPIRRFVDLINQMQIVHHARHQKPLFEEAYLLEMIPEIEKRILLIRETVQRSERYWLLKHIEARLLHSPLEGLLRATGNGRYRVEILPWGKQLWLSLDAPPADESFNFVVYAVDWDKQILKADLIG